jgi:hypothetical protein
VPNLSVARKLAKTPKGAGCIAGPITCYDPTHAPAYIMVLMRCPRGRCQACDALGETCWSRHGGPVTRVTVDDAVVELAVSELRPDEAEDLAALVKNPAAVEIIKRALATEGPGALRSREVLERARRAVNNEPLE